MVKSFASSTVAFPFEDESVTPMQISQTLFFGFKIAEGVHGTHMSDDGRQFAPLTYRSSTAETETWQLHAAALGSKLEKENHYAQALSKRHLLLISNH